MWSLSGVDGNGRVPSRYGMSVSMYRGGGGRGNGRPRSAPPDLPSLLLDARICYLGMPVRQVLHSVLSASSEIWSLLSGDLIFHLFLSVL